MRIKRIAFIIVMVTLLSKFIGFFRDVILANYYGASAISDAYIIALTIPGVIFAFIGVSISTSFIPIYTNIFKNEGLRPADNFLNNLISIFFILCTIIVIIVTIFTEQFVKVFALGFDKDTLEMAITFTRISVYSIYFSMMTHIYSAYLNIKEDFLTPALMGIPFNIILIVSIVVGANTSEIILPIGIILSIATQFLFIKLALNRRKYRFEFKINFKDRHLKEILILSLPVILGVSVNQINILVDRSIASYISVGGISMVNYSSKLNDFILGLFVLSLLSIVFPKMANYSADGKVIELKKLLLDFLKSINLILIPLIFFIASFSYQIVSVVYGRGAFDENAVTYTSLLLKFYIVGLIAVAYREVITKVFFSLKDTKTPTINAIIGLTVNIILNIYLTILYGIVGLAIATSIAACVTVLLLFITLPKKIGEIKFTEIFLSILKVSSIASIVSFTSNFLYKYLIIYTQNDYWSLALTFIGYLFCILILYKIFKFDEVNFVFNGVYKFLRINKK